MSEKKHLETIDRGIQAKNIISNTLLKEAVEETKSRLNKQILDSKYADKEGREECYVLIKAVDSVMAQVNQYISDGKHSQTLLDGLKSNIKKLIKL